MTPPDPDDVWAYRRRLGDALRRWAGSRPADPHSPRRRQRRFCAHPWRWPGFRRPDRRDRGAATVLVLAMGLVLVAAGVAGAAVGSARMGRHRAQVAADLGALAGAGHAIEGEEVACAAAGRFVRANAARMSSCAVDGLEIVVWVDVAVTSLPGPARHAQAAARAGPVYAIVG